MAIPYESATSGAAAREETTRLLRRMGCGSVGFMDHFDTGEVTLAFTHRGRPVKLRASAKGWARWYLREHPHGPRVKRTRQEHDAAALRQGMIAINSIIRDWAKASVSAAECGVFSFEAAFMPHMLTAGGLTLLEAATQQGLLPPPKETYYD